MYASGENDIVLVVTSHSVVSWDYNISKKQYTMDVGESGLLRWDYRLGCHKEGLYTFVSGCKIIKCSDGQVM